MCVHVFIGSALTIIVLALLVELTPLMVALFMHFLEMFQVWLLRLGLDFSGGSRFLKCGGGHCGAKEKEGSEDNCLSCMVIFRCFEEYMAMINPIKLNISV